MIKLFAAVGLVSLVCVVAPCQADAESLDGTWQFELIGLDYRTPEASFQIYPTCRYGLVDPLEEYAAQTHVLRAIEVLEP